MYSIMLETLLIDNGSEKNSEYADIKKCSLDDNTAALLLFFNHCTRLYQDPRRVCKVLNSGTGECVPNRTQLGSLWAIQNSPGPRRARMVYVYNYNYIYGGLTDSSRSWNLLEHVQLLQECFTRDDVVLE